MGRGDVVMDMSIALTTAQAADLLKRLQSGPRVPTAMPLRCCHACGRELPDWWREVYCPAGCTR